MMTEWHGLKAGVREKERRVEAMKRNLEVVKRENDVFFERLRGRSKVLRARVLVWGH
jgi:hypothetical protein